MRVALASMDPGLGEASGEGASNKGGRNHTPEACNMPGITFLITIQAPMLSFFSTKGIEVELAIDLRLQAVAGASSLIEKHEGAVLAHLRYTSACMGLSGHATPRRGR
jgi:hypothetical protein